MKCNQLLKTHILSQPPESACKLAYGHMLLDTLFTWGELKKSLLFSLKTKVKNQTLDKQKSGTATKQVVNLILAQFFIECAMCS